VQNTRLHIFGGRALLQLEIGASVGALAGAMSFLDPLAALLFVVLAELAIRARKPLLRKGGDKLLLGLMDMARMGLVYGLLLEGFKASV